MINKLIYVALAFVLISSFSFYSNWDFACRQNDRLSAQLKKYDAFERYKLIDKDTRFDIKTGNVELWTPWRDGKREWVNGKGFTDGYWRIK